MMMMTMMEKIVREERRKGREKKWERRREKKWERRKERESEGAERDVVMSCYIKQHQV